MNHVCIVTLNKFCFGFIGGFHIVCVDFCFSHKPNITEEVQMSSSGCDCRLFVLLMYLNQKSISFVYVLYKIYRQIALNNFQMASSYWLFLYSIYIKNRELANLV